MKPTRIIITVKVDVTDFLPEWYMKMSDDDIKEWIGDTPEAIQGDSGGGGDLECDDKGNIAWNVERNKQN